MVREDIINSAVSFLQDPSVAQATIDKKIAFLQSKNLTQDEIDVSLSRVGDGPPPAGTQSFAPANYGYRQPQGPPQGYSQYPGQWQQPPPEVPRRDWRDWFIMATVMGGVSYGLYFTAKRYIIPLIAPPTPPQLEQDKQTIDESFEKAFALLDQLNTDTTALKAAEESRTLRVDSALADLESVLSSLKEADRKREDEARRNADEIRNLRDLIPKAIDGQKDATDARLKTLGEELKSLSKLIGNRMSASTTPAPNTNINHRSTNSGNGTTLGYTPSSTVQPMGTVAGAPVSPALSSPATTNGTSATTTSTDAPISPAVVPERSQSSTPFSSSRFGGAGKASIPAWQMAAAKKSQDALDGASEKKDTSASGTAVESTA